MDLVNRNNNIYIWSYVYVFVILMFTRYVSSYSLTIWVLFLLLALPFYAYLDKFAIICFLFSTLSDYFSGVGEGVLGLHSILIILVLINAIVKKKTSISLRGQLFSFLLIISFWLSYSQSSFHYINGAYSMTYVVLICMVITGFVKTEDDTLRDFLPSLSAIIVLYFVIVLIANGDYVFSMLSIRSDINHNAFGRCLAQLSTVFAVRVSISERKKGFYYIVWGITILLTLFTGSRNALLAEFVTIVFVYIFVQKRKGSVINLLMKGLIGISILLIVLSVVLPDAVIFADRYSISTLIATGGTNRTTIWKRLIPLIMREYPWFGYGPGYYCSAQIVSALVNRAYTNTHNIFLEAWGELGIVGLLCFVGIVTKSFHNVIKGAASNINLLFIVALFVDILINGIGESMFAGTNLWIIIGLCYSMKMNYNARVEEDHEYSCETKRQVSNVL